MYGIRHISYTICFLLVSTPSISARSQIQRPASGTCTYRGSCMAPTAGFLDAERVLQRFRGVRGQDDATETGRRATPQRIVDIVRNKTLK